MRLSKAMREIMQPVIDAVMADPSILARDDVREFINSHWDAFRAYDIEQVRTFERLYGVHITINHTGKMRGVWSLSTSCLDNERCMLRATSGNHDCICDWCFSQAMHRRYKGLANVLHKNSEVLMHTVLPIEAFPVFFTLEIFRLESFGDLATIVQMINYDSFMRRNPVVAFGLYTKNPDIIERWSVFTGNTLVANVTVNYGSPTINHANTATIERYRAYIHHNFLVINRHGLLSRLLAMFGRCTGRFTSRQLGKVVTCGARCCDTCRRCYRRSGAFDVVEMLKQDIKILTDLAA